MSYGTKAPPLHFFRSTPAGLKVNSALASSLQSFESCLFLIALERYPHAFVNGVFSAEIVAKAALAGLPQQQKNIQKTILKQAKKELKYDAGLRTRNRIVHEGFTRDDDKLATRLLIETVLPYLGDCYQRLFDFSLLEGLLKEYAEQLRIASQVVRGLKATDNVNITLCLRPLGHLIRWQLRNSFMSQAEIELAGNYTEHLDVVIKRVEQLKRIYEPWWVFKCPVCKEVECFVAQLDDKALDRKAVSLLKGRCAECELVIPSGCPGLADSLCRDQITDACSEILHEYGCD